MARSERRAQLLATARELIREDGTDGLTLARLAERAGVTKPLVYDHFGDRAGVLAELYREFEAHQRETLDAALEQGRHDLATVVDLVSGAYLDCCVAEGREMADVVAALSGSVALTSLRQEAEDAYLVMARAALEPLAGPIPASALRAVVGAGDALARSVLDGDVTATDARRVLARVVSALVGDRDDSRRSDT
ncbi:TetR/AcrR family transcriptional regulator [Nocardioides sp. SYSU D00065]|uniref:TetR/AcrR family transcriptional regulator n=1 Tax=Nocardioides sp. SYSU D00065 TaxID=2817378 RepID=UPI001B3368FD|nr:TetR/AcrR family transcriptional regulator [Nocardioides sp. SYSU D00065]